MFKAKDGLLFPSDRESVAAIIKRWKITDEQLANAIVETGSIHTAVLRDHFRKKGVIFSLSVLLQRIWRIQ